MSHFSADDLWQATHTNDLQRRDKITLEIDHRHKGVGGASCGPETLAKYQVAPGKFRFAVRLRPVFVSEGQRGCDGITASDIAGARN